MGRTQSRERSRTRDRQDKMTSLWPDSDNRGRVTIHRIWSSAAQRPQAMVMVKTAMRKRQKDYGQLHMRDIYIMERVWGGGYSPPIQGCLHSLLEQLSPPGLGRLDKQ